MLQGDAQPCRLRTEQERRTSIVGRIANSVQRSHQFDSWVPLARADDERFWRLSEDLSIRIWVAGKARERRNRVAEAARGATPSDGCQSSTRRQTLGRHCPSKPVLVGKYNPSCRQRRSHLRVAGVVQRHKTEVLPSDSLEADRPAARRRGPRPLWQRCACGRLSHNGQQSVFAVAISRSRIDTPISGLHAQYERLE